MSTRAALSGKYAIVGVSELLVGKFPDQTTLGLHVEAVRLALNDAGLKNTDIDGIISHQPRFDPMRDYTLLIAKASGITPTYMTDISSSGEAPVFMAQQAMLAIEAGLCETVLCVHARKGATREGPSNVEIREGSEEYYLPYGIAGGIITHAFMASRHMHDFGTTRAQLGAVSVAARKHALLNPNAIMKKPMTIADHAASRPIAAPLHLFDCSLPADGGGAYIVTRIERARAMKNTPVVILGTGKHHVHANLANAPSLTTLGGKVSSQQAFAMAGLKPADMDFAQFYDCFSITTIGAIEDYGFCAKGEGGPFVENGRIEIGGELPVNTHGGLLSQGHIEGMMHVTEAIRQLRHEIEPARQVKDAQLGVVSGHGGHLASHASLILGRDTR